MKRRSFLKIIGLAVAAPSSLAGVAVPAHLFNPTYFGKNPAMIILDLTKQSNFSVPIDEESFHVVARILDKHVNWIGVDNDG